MKKTQKWYSCVSNSELNQHYSFSIIIKEKDSMICSFINLSPFFFDGVSVKLTVEIQYEMTRFTQKFITSSLACQILFEALLKFLKAVMAVILQLISDVMGQCSNIY